MVHLSIVSAIFEDAFEAIIRVNGVDWLYDQGITTGTGATEFSPDGVVTRGQMATFLWRLAGSPV